MGRTHLRRKSVFAAVAIASGIGAIITAAPAGAAPSQGAPVIDKSFEECLIQHFQRRFFSRIEATDKQKQQLSALFARRAEETRPLREQLRRGLVELSDLMAADEASEEQIRDKAKEVRQIHNQIMDERLNSLLAVRAELTPRQRQLISNRIAFLLSGQWRPAGRLGD